MITWGEASEWLDKHRCPSCRDFDKRKKQCGINRRSICIQGAPAEEVRKMFRRNK